MEQEIEHFGKHFLDTPSTKILVVCICFFLVPLFAIFTHALLTNHIALKTTVLTLFFAYASLFRVFYQIHDARNTIDKVSLLQNTPNSEQMLKIVFGSKASNIVYYGAVATAFFVGLFAW